MLLWASIAAAQQPGSVSGTVYDSVARAPLQGAIVQMVPPAGTPMYTATTDARGRYTIPDAPPGKYFIEFVHSALDSLALEPPLRAVEVHAAQMAKMDLAIPAPSTIVTQTCRTTPADSAALFFGVLRDSRSRIGIDSGHVTARWFELIIDAAGLNKQERSASSRTNAEGWFAMCGIPANTEVVVAASHKADSTGMSVVNIPADGLRRFDLDIGGVATVRGRIVSRGRAVENARVRVGAEERATYTDSAGNYRLGGVRAGTQTIDVRALGYAPETKALALSPDTDTVIDIELTTVKRVMDTIKVVAERVYSIDAVGFERRRRAGGGMFFDENTVRRRSPFSVMQLLYDVPTFRLVQSGFEKTILFRRLGQLCQPAFYLNGVSMPSELLSDLDLFVRPHQLEGMEVYRNSGPAEFHNPCGSIVVWTKRGAPRKR